MSLSPFGNTVDDMETPYLGEGVAAELEERQYDEPAKEEGSMMTEKESATSSNRPANLTVRCVSTADAAAAARLLHDFNTESNYPSPGPEFLTKRVADLIGSGDVTVLVAGDGPDGIAVLRLRPALWADGQDAHLEELYVTREKRGQGMGRALLEETMEVARHAGAVRIDLGTGEDDTEARRLYESAGFANHDSEGAQMLFYERDL